MPLYTHQVAWLGIRPPLLWFRAFVSAVLCGQSCCRPVHIEVQLNLSKIRDGHRRVLAVIAFLGTRWPADEIADRARRQSELGEEPDGGAGRDHVGEVLLGVGGDQYDW